MKYHKPIKKYLACISLLLLTLSPFSSIVLAEEATAPTEPPAQTQTVDAPSSADPAQTPVVAPTDQPQTTPDPASDAPKTVTVPQNETVTPINQNADQATSTQQTEEKSDQTASDNDAKSTEKDATNIDTDNTAKAENAVDATVDTGDNQASENDGDASVTSGDAKIALSILNLINSTLLPLSSNGIKFVVKNEDNQIGDIVIDPVTGNISALNSGPVILGNINNLNDGDLLNKINLNGNTGNNEASKNDGDTQVKTGNVNLSLNLLNLLNSTFVVGSFGSIGVMNIFGNLNGNIVVPKLTETAQTDDSQSKLANIWEKIKNLFSNDNKAEVSNTISESTNTGANEANANDGNVNVTTGSLKQLLNLNNFANMTLIGDTVYMAVINVLGKWNGQSLTSPLVALFTDGKLVLDDVANKIANLGDNQKVKENESNAVTNNNTSMLTNLINFFANTGNNTANENDGNVSVNTGNISIISNIFNLSNFNIIANKFVFLIINVFGDWNGNITQTADKPQTQDVSIVQNEISSTQPKVIRVAFARFNEYGNVSSAGPTAIDYSPDNSEPINPFKIEKPSSVTAMTNFVLDNLDRIVLVGFLIYLLGIGVYFANKRAKIIDK